MTVVFVLCLEAFSQSKEAPKNSCACQLSSVFNAEGFAVPGVAGATTKSPRDLYRSGNLKSAVYVTAMQAGEKTGKVLWLHCSKDIEGATQIQNIEVEVLDLWKFDIDGNVFAYGLTGGWMGRDSSGKPIRLGTAEDKLFYDVDGSGRFKLMKNADFPFLLDVPQWALKSANKNEQP